MSVLNGSLTEKQNSRIAWIDVAKALAMALIVFGHVDVSSFEQAFVYSFHIPVFIFLSGYCFSDRDRFSDFLKKKLLHIMVPYVFFGLFAIAAYVVMAEYVSDLRVRSLGECFCGLLMGNAKTENMTFNQHLWFLPCLFMMSVIFYGLKRLTDRITEKLGADRIYGAVGMFAVTMLVSVVLLNLKISMCLPFSTEIAIKNMPFFALGFLMKTSGKISGDADRKNKKQIFILAAGFLICIGLTAFFAYKNYVHAPGMKYMILYHKDFYGEPLFFYGAAFAGTAAVVCLAKLIPAFRCLTYLGRNTLSVLVMQKFLIMPARMVIERLPQKQIILVPAYLFFTVAVIVLCLAADWIIRKYFPFLYGMPYKNRRKK